MTAMSGAAVIAVSQLLHDARMAGMRKLRRGKDGASQGLEWAVCKHPKDRWQPNPLG